MYLYSDTPNDSSCVHSSRKHWEPLHIHLKNCHHMCMVIPDEISSNLSGLHPHNWLGKAPPGKRAGCEGHLENQQLL